MHNLRKSIRITFALGILSALALVVSNLALMDIQHGGGFTLEWAIMHISYGIFILFHIFAIVTLARMLRRENERKAE
ncbi:MAG TPA: hypothetical protein VFZ34_24760 [Blastocatellia bacterium]|nr:hypothetical protein [Blastocatellia bacterium]